MHLKRSAKNPLHIQILNRNALSPINFLLYDPLISIEN